MTVPRAVGIALTNSLATSGIAAAWVIIGGVVATVFVCCTWAIASGVLDGTSFLN